MQLNQWRVGTRLTVAFALVALLTLLGDLFAVWQISQANDRLRRIVLENNVKLEHANDMSDATHIESRVLRSMILLNDVEAAKQQAVKIPKAREAYDKAWAALNAFPPSDKARALRAEMAAAVDQTRSVYDRVLSLSLAGQGAEATRLVMADGLTASTRLQDAIDRNLDHIKAENLGKYETSQQAYGAAIQLMVVLVLVSLALSALMAWLLTRSITRPLAQAVQMANAMAEGRLDTQLQPQGRDELSTLQRAMVAMQDTLSGIVAKVRLNAEGVATASTEIAQGNGDLSRRTEQQASALQQTAASMEQLNAAVQHNAQSAHQANQLASGASDVAQRGGGVVAEMVRTMKGIDESSRRIADIIGLIDTIAFQTNILALNAAVEAARAGEQGRGFAVVATEVRSLAGRSAAAAKEIKALINTSVERVAQGSVLADQAGTTMQDVVGAIQRVNDLMAEISAASTQQSQGVSEVGTAISQMDHVTQQNSALVEESAAAAESLRQQAASLVHAVQVFRTAATAYAHH